MPSDILLSNSIAHEYVYSQDQSIFERLWTIFQVPMINTHFDRNIARDSHNLKSSLGEDR